MAVRPLSTVDPDSSGAHAPVRTCIGCRRREVAAELLRVVVAPDPTGGPFLAVPDPRHRAPGRGAWLHPVPECVALAERRRAFARALRVPGSLDPTPTREYVAERDGNDEQRPVQLTGGTPQEI